MKKIFEKVSAIITALSVALPLSIMPTTVLAANLSGFPEGFGSGSDLADIPNWEEHESGTIAKNPTINGEDTASPDGGRFAKIAEDGNDGGPADGYICREVDAEGMTDLQLAYYWRGDADAEGSGGGEDDGIVEGRNNGNGDANCATPGGWDQLQNHDLSIDATWSTQSAFDLPEDYDDSKFLIRFRNNSTADDEYFRVDGINITGNAIVIPDTDADDDGVIDDDDNCPINANPGQEDNDEDGIGNVCDETPNGDDKETGSIEITKYLCLIGTELLRSVNGVGGTVPDSCIVDEGVTFGYLHNPNQTDANGPYPEVTEANLNGTDLIGTTNSSGTLTFAGLEATGRYLVFETNADGDKLPDSEILNLYCEGDGEQNDAASDNQELTFVEEGQTAQCVAYNEGDFEVVDMCPNIEGDQASIPEDMEIVEGDCVNCSEDSFVVVSDATTQVDGGNALVLIDEDAPGINGNWEHDAWTDSLAGSGASWIWDADGVNDPLIDEVEVFTKGFIVGDDVHSAILDIATDNSYVVKINGTEVGSSLDENNFSSPDQIDVTAYVIVGSNTLEITVTNKGADIPENPAGLVYRLSVTAGSCDGPNGGGGDNGNGGDGSAIIWVNKLTHGIGGTFNFALSGSGVEEEDGQFALTTEGDGDQDSRKIYVNPSGDDAQYTITEILPDG